MRRANVIYPDEVVMLKEPRFKYRSYLRSRRVTPEEVAILKNWVEAQQGEIQPSGALKQFMNREASRWYLPVDYTADYYYFDHNDPRYVTMLAMVLPVPIRKTVPIVAK